MRDMGIEQRINRPEMAERFRRKALRAGAVARFHPGQRAGAPGEVRKGPPFDEHSVEQDQRGAARVGGRAFGLIRLGLAF
jgi:hypothetical protein